MAKVYGLYAIYDKDAEQHSPVQQFPNDKTAYRAYLSTMQREQLPLESFEMRRLAEIDEQTGLIQSIIPYDVKEAIDTSVFK